MTDASVPVDERELRLDVLDGIDMPAEKQLELIELYGGIDVAPTILEAAAIAPPQSVDGIEQMPLHGVSFAYTFDDARAAERHTQQYFEIFGNRAMYKDGWLAGARLERTPWRLDLKQVSKYAPGSDWNPDGDRGAARR